MNATCATPGKTARVVDNIHHGPVFVLCECGPGFPVDEDGCCLMCGHDAFRNAFECAKLASDWNAMRREPKP